MGDNATTTPEVETRMDNELFALGMRLDTRELQQEYKQHLMRKWGGYRNGKYNEREDWIGDGAAKRDGIKISSDHHRASLALMLENQKKYQRSKTMQVVGNQVLQQDTSTADEALPTKYVFPLVRRIYAQIMQADFSSVQPMAGPTGYVFYLDFIREGDSSNILSVEYNWMTTSELGVPPKAKLSLQRKPVSATKQIMGMGYSLESLEDAQAILGIDVEQELLNAFSEEFARTLFARHITEVSLTAGATATGTGLPTPWNQGAAAVVLPNRGTNSIADYKSQLYNALIDADTTFVRANRTSSSGIIAGYGLAGLLSKMLTATSTSGPQPDNTSGLGVTNYGTYAERWRVWGTEFLPDNVGFMYLRNPDPLRAGHVYSPYIPVQVMPQVYADYDPTTGNYQNRDAYTRNIRERSASTVTKPYAFVQINGPAGGLGQFS